MSRSYRKKPVCKDKSKGMKTIAAKRLRRKGLDDIPNGMGYKKLFDSWSISDYKFMKTWQERLIQLARRYGRNLTERELTKEHNDWEKAFKRK